VIGARSHRGEIDMVDPGFERHKAGRPDGMSRRGFLQCMTWAGTGFVWTVAVENDVLADGGREYLSRYGRGTVGGRSSSGSRRMSRRSGAAPRSWCAT
jgi:hypothetical protein